MIKITLKFEFLKKQVEHEIELPIIPTNNDFVSFSYNGKTIEGKVVYRTIFENSKIKLHLALKSTQVVDYF